MSSLTKDEQDSLRLLVQHVARAFYEPKFTVVLDQLVRHPVLKDDDLAGRMGLQMKELNKIMAVLESDRLIRIHRQNELKEGAQRAVARQYYYIDYQHFCNVVKWRVAEMRRRIDSTLRNELDNKGYICPQCNKSFSPLEADKLIDMTVGAFLCDICHAELVDNENAESVRGSQDRMQRFNRQMRFIREGLRKSEDMVLPAFDVAFWIKMNIVDSEKAKANAAGLKIAGGSNTAHPDSIGVVLSVDKDEAAQRLERDREANAKRMQNILPAWHLKSTITGDLTALGVRAETGIAEAVDGNKLPGEDIVFKMNGSTGLSQQLSSQALNGDTKPKINQTQTADYYDQYYASLAFTSAQSSPDGGIDIGDEEEDVKPSIEYLDSLNDYRKRSRSQEDVGRGDEEIKQLKLGAGASADLYTNGNGLTVASIAPATNGEVAPDDDPVVFVNGEAVPFSHITEEHQELMTPEEYTAYFGVYSTRT